MKVYWHATAPWGSSSYSILTQRVVPELVRMGHKVCVGTWYGLEGQPQTWPIRHRNDPKGPIIDTVTILPCVNGASYGVDTFHGAYQMFGADVAITCMDVWVLPANLTSQIKFCPWFPVDHDPLPQQIADALIPAIYPMTYSKWGAEVCAKAGIDAKYIPCSADMNTFRPMPMKEAREAIGLPGKLRDGFLVTMVAANKDPSDRKGFGEALTGFAEFAKKHDDAYLYMHTNWIGPINIAHLAERLGIETRIIRPDPMQYMMGMYDEKYMRAVYSASHLLLNPAKSEGFGMPILEAQMCGTPVANSDFSSTDELLFAGWKIKGQRHWSLGADSFRYMVYVDSVADVLEEAYSEKNNEILRKQARKGAIFYDTERIAKEYWKPALKDIEEIVCGSAGQLQMVTF